MSIQDNGISSGGLNSSLSRQSTSFLYSPSISSQSQNLSDFGANSLSWHRPFPLPVYQPMPKPIGCGCGGSDQNSALLTQIVGMFQQIFTKMIELIAAQQSGAKKDGVAVDTTLTGNTTATSPTTGATTAATPGTPTSSPTQSVAAPSPSTTATPTTPLGVTQQPTDWVTTLMSSLDKLSQLLGGVRKLVDAVVGKAKKVGKNFGELFSMFGGKGSGIKNLIPSLSKLGTSLTKLF